MKIINLITAVKIIFANTFIILAGNIKAEDILSPVVINEFMPNPAGTDTDYEWIELFNHTDSPVNLKDWVIDGKTIPERLLAPKSFLIVATNKNLFASRYGVGHDVIQLGISLKNTSDLVILKNNTFIDEINYDSVTEEKSWERINNCSPDIAINTENNSAGEVNLNFVENYCNPSANTKIECSLNTVDFYEACSGFANEPINIRQQTEGTLSNIVWKVADQIVSNSENFQYSFQNLGENILTLKALNNGSEINVTKTVYIFPRIFLNEIMPNPEDTDSGNEWIELYAENLESYELSQWKVSDNTSTEIFTLNLVNKFGVYVPTLSLNNSSETISLFTPSGLLSDSFTYENTTEGQSFSKNVDGIGEWVVDYQVTKGTTNLPYEDNLPDNEIISIKEAKGKLIGDIVFVKGTSSVNINKLGSNTFYIQDNTAGIKVVLKSDIVNLIINEGDVITLYGELRESRDEFYIYVSLSDNLNIEKLNKSIAPISISNQLESLEGSLVKVEGVITSTSGNTFYVKDNYLKSDFKISILASAKISGIEKKKDDKTIIFGILSQWGMDEEGNPNYRILPRKSSDINILSNSSSRNPVYKPQISTQTNLGNKELANNVDLNPKIFLSPSESHNNNFIKIEQRKPTIFFPVIFILILVLGITNLYLKKEDLNKLSSKVIALLNRL